MNAATWQPSVVTLATGEQVLSDSEAWRAECDARTWWRKLDAMNAAGTLDTMAGITRKRGQAGADRLREDIARLEPYFALDLLPSKEARKAYLSRVAARRGQAARQTLEAAILAVWRARQSTAEPAA